ncbi:MAG: hypothetical protein OXG81_00575 [Acidobacteria bacterium]|nr:hypothetical protein [Acidobacteriota bacterium]
MTPCHPHVEKSAAPVRLSGCADLLVRLPPEAARDTRRPQAGSAQHAT